MILPHYFYLTASTDIWLYFLDRRYATLDSRIVDIGSGVGKSAVALRDLDYAGDRFRGLYQGFDVDPEMVQWCQENFPSDRFKFELVDMYTKVYNPRGSLGAKPRLNCEDASVDFVFSQSLFSHLLEKDIRHYIGESFRVLRPGGAMLMTFFCLDDLERLQLIGGRWTFRHRLGPSYVEDENFPESAVAYRKAWILEAARSCGFSHARVILPAYQSTLECIK
jgi:SAM-dependent methyltransferase